MGLLKELILKYGKNRINTLTKYPSILTLHEYGKKGTFLEELTTDLENETLTASEKIDGVNIRIITYGDEYLIGSRAELLYFNTDFFWNTSLNIVQALKDLKVPIFKTKHLTVIYGELYGKLLTKESKQYGTDKYGFRVFDSIEFKNESILHNTLSYTVEQISSQREKVISRDGFNYIRYGQPFVNVREKYKGIYDLVPQVEFNPKNFSREAVLEEMSRVLPFTKVALSDKALMVPEGLVVRNTDRTKIVKLKLKNYLKTFKK